MDNPRDVAEFHQRTGVAVALDESVDEGLVGKAQTDSPLGTQQGVVALVRQRGLIFQIDYCVLCEV